LNVFVLHPSTGSKHELTEMLTTKSNLDDVEHGRHGISEIGKHLRRLSGPTPPELRYGSRAPAPSPCWTCASTGDADNAGSLRTFFLKSSELRVNQHGPRHAKSRVGAVGCEEAACARLCAAP